MILNFELFYLINAKCSHVTFFLKEFAKASEYLIKKDCASDQVVGISSKVLRYVFMHSIPGTGRNVLYLAIPQSSHFEHLAVSLGFVYI